MTAGNTILNDDFTPTRRVHVEFTTLKLPDNGLQAEPRLRG